MLPEIVLFPDLKRVYNIEFCRPQINRMEREGTFPARIPLSANRVAWLRSEIIEWLNARVAARDRALEAREPRKKRPPATRRSL
jgi:hypothetical protein